jgi:hypothetical protein
VLGCPRVDRVYVVCVRIVRVWVFVFGLSAFGLSACCPRVVRVLSACCPRWVVIELSGFRLSAFGVVCKLSACWVVRVWVVCVWVVRGRVVCVWVVRGRVVCVWVGSSRLVTFSFLFLFRFLFFKLSFFHFLQE